MVTFGSVITQVPIDRIKTSLLFCDIISQHCNIDHIDTPDKFSITTQQHYVDWLMSDTTIKTNNHSMSNDISGDVSNDKLDGILPIESSNIVNDIIFADFIQDSDYLASMWREILLEWNVCYPILKSVTHEVRLSLYYHIPLIFVVYLLSQHYVDIHVDSVTLPFLKQWLQCNVKSSEDTNQCQQNKNVNGNPDQHLPDCLLEFSNMPIKEFTVGHDVYTHIIKEDSITSFRNGARYGLSLKWLNGIIKQEAFIDDNVAVMQLYNGVVYYNSNMRSTNSYRKIQKYYNKLANSLVTKLHLVSDASCHNSLIYLQLEESVCPFNDHDFDYEIHEHVHTGYFKVYDETKNYMVSSRAYNNEHRVGVYTSWYQTGTKHFECHYDNVGCKQKETTWCQNGNIISIKNYLHGVKSEEWKTWSDDGVYLLSHCHYSRNKLHGTCTYWFPNTNNIKSINNYQYGKKHGLQQTWYQPNNIDTNNINTNSGVKESEMSYLSDKLHGVSKKWDQQGNLISSVQYRNDEIVGVGK